jgi:hypothetical protein
MAETEHSKASRAKILAANVFFVFIKVVVSRIFLSGQLGTLCHGTKHDLSFSLFPHPVFQNSKFLVK